MTSLVSPRVMIMSVINCETKLSSCLSDNKGYLRIYPYSLTLDLLALVINTD